MSLFCVSQSAKGEKTNVDTEGMQELPDDLGMYIETERTFECVQNIPLCVKCPYKLITTEQDGHHSTQNWYISAYIYNIVTTCFISLPGLV